VIEFSLQFPAADAEAFRAQLNRLINELGKAPEEAVRMATLALLRALRASTRKAPARARVTREKIMRPNLRTGRTRSITLQDAYVAHRFDPRTGSPRQLRISAQSLQEARESRLARIDYSGLARASWGWAAQALFPSSGERYSGRRPVRPTHSVDKRGSGNDYSITVVNKLDYIESAFNTGRGPAVSSALARASATLRGRIEQRLKGAIR